MSRRRADRPGDTVGITYDWTVPDQEPPGEGDHLVCVSRKTGRPSGTAYLIVGARPVNRRVEHAPWETRMAYRAVRVHLADALLAHERGGRVESLVWHPRRRR